MKLNAPPIVKPPSDVPKSSGFPGIDQLQQPASDNGFQNSMDMVNSLNSDSNSGSGSGSGSDSSSSGGSSGSSSHSIQASIRLTVTPKT